MLFCTPAELDKLLNHLTYLPWSCKFKLMSNSFNKLGLALFILNMAFVAYLSVEIRSNPDHALVMFKEVRNLALYAYFALFTAAGILIAGSKLKKDALFPLIGNTLIITYSYFLASIFAGALR